MNEKMTPESKRVVAAAMNWWRFWRGPATEHPMDPALLAFYTHPITRQLVETCADLDALQSRAQGEQLNSDTGPGDVEQQ